LLDSMYILVEVINLVIHHEVVGMDISKNNLKNPYKLKQS